MHVIVIVYSFTQLQAKYDDVQITHTKSPAELDHTH